MPEEDSLRDVCRCECLSLCYLTEAHTLLVGDTSSLRSLLVKQRKANTWRESVTVPMEWPPDILCALGGARVLCGSGYSKHMTLYQVETGGNIKMLHKVRVDEEFASFAATTRGTDTLVAMSLTNSVRLHRLIYHQLKELSRIALNEPSLLLWTGETLLAAVRKESISAHSVLTLELKNNQLTRRRQLQTEPERISINCWCLMGDQLALFDDHSLRILVYPSPLQNTVVLHPRKSYAYR